MRTGISKLISLITAASSIHDDVRLALTDNKISFTEAIGIAFGASRYWSIVADFKNIWQEIKDLTPEDSEAISAHFALVWRVPKPQAEARWKAAFEFLTETVEFINKWRTASELAKA